MNENAESLAVLHTHTHTHTLCLQEKRNLNLIGLISVAKKLYIKYENIKVDMLLLHRQTVF